MTGIRGRFVGVAFAAVIGLSLAAKADAADWQIRPFVGFTFAGDTTFSPNLSDPAGKAHTTVGINAVVLGEILGIDVDIAHTAGFFQPDPFGLVLNSGVTTATANVVVGAPRRFTEYVLRPYVVGGAGIMRIRTEDYFQVSEIAETRPTIDVGVGAIGFITKRVGVAWEVRRFQMIGAGQQNGLSLGDEKLSFWRGTMAVAVRF